MYEFSIHSWESEDVEGQLHALFYAILDNGLNQRKTSDHAGDQCP